MPVGGDAATYSGDGAELTAYRRMWSNQYEYTPANVDKYAPNSAGLYLLSYQTDNDYIFHLGQGHDLNKALQEHLSLPAPCSSRQAGPGAPDSFIKKHLQDYACYFRFVQVASEETRIRIVSAPEHNFGPKDKIDFAYWAHNFVTKINAHPAAYGLTPAGLAELKAGYQAYLASYDAQIRAQIALRAAEKRLKDAQQKYKDDQQKGGSGSIPV